MSTILKALRRLEADGAPEAREHEGATNTLPATDPRAADELRDRILAEESAARIQSRADQARLGGRPLVLISIVACLVVAAGVAGYLLTHTASPPDSARVASSASSAASAAAGIPTPPVPAATVGESRLAEAAPNAATAKAAAPRRGVPIGVPIESLPMLSGKAAPARKPAANQAARSTPTNPETARNAAPMVAIAPTSAAAKVAPAAPVGSEARARSADAETAPMPVAAVVPTRARAAADAPSAAAPSKAALARVDSASAKEPSPSASKPVALSSSKPKAAPAASHVEPVSAAVAKPKPRPAAKPAAEAKPVEQVVRQSLPDITVLRTAWHPTPARRSAKIRLESTDEVLTLHEGDAVGGLIVHEISPSAVVFMSGDVEIRRRVGQP